MSRSGIPKEKQGTALGIFGAGNVGAAVTKFAAPVIMVAYGWKTVALVWAAVLAIMAVVFFLFTKDDPDLARRRASGEKPESLSAMMEPLKNIQVWRFSLYYFFVFGAFVALALWLPRYLIGVYGLDITTAGMIGAAYSIPASIFRAYGGHLSDKFGARRIMYWTFLVSVVCTFILSYPPTQYVVEGIRGPVAFSTRMGLVGLHRRHLRARLLHEPRQGGRLQAHPGLLSRPRRRGGRRRRPRRRPRRLRPADRLRRAQRPDRRLAELLLAAVPDRLRLAGLDACRRPADGARRARGWRAGRNAARTARNAADPRRRPRQGALAATGAIQDWRPEDKTFWDARRACHRAAQSVDLGALPAAVLRGLDGVVGRRREAAVASASPSPTSSSSGWPRCRACPARRCASSTASCRRSSAAGCGRRWRPGRC